jgi:hypothetical protein
MECRLAGETEVLGENQHQRHFCPSQNPTWPDPGLNPGRRDGKCILIIMCMFYAQQFYATSYSLCFLVSKTMESPKNAFFFSAAESVLRLKQHQTCAPNILYTQYIQNSCRLKYVKYVSQEILYVKEGSFKSGWILIQTLRGDISRGFFHI